MFKKGKYVTKMPDTEQELVFVSNTPWKRPIAMLTAPLPSEVRSCMRTRDRNELIVICMDFMVQIMPGLWVGGLSAPLDFFEGITHVCSICEFEPAEIIKAERLKVDVIAYGRTRLMMSPCFRLMSRTRLQRS